MRFFKSEKGSAIVVEAAFIFPIVFITLIAFYTLAIYMLEIGILHSRAQKIALQTARSISMPGYSLVLSDEVTSASDLDGISDESVKSMFESDNLPYRYLIQFGEKSVGKGGEGVLANEITNNIPRFLSGTVEAEMEYKNYIVTSYIQITVTRSFTYPPIFKWVGLNGSLDKTITVRSTVSDSAEFVRNIDFAGDVISFVAEHFNLDGKMDEIMKKVSKVVN